MQPLEPSSSITFYVPGRPASQGSKTFYGRGRVIDSCGWLESWRASVKAAALEARPKDFRMIERPSAFGLVLTFFRPRPSRHYRKDGALNKIGLTALPIPDLDILKMGRAVEDALAGILYQTDRMNMDLRASSQWADDHQRQGVRVIVHRFDPTGGE